MTTYISVPVELRLIASDDLDSNQIESLVAKLKSFDFPVYADSDRGDLLDVVKEHLDVDASAAERALISKIESVDLWSKENQYSVIKDEI